MEKTKGKKRTRGEYEFFYLYYLPYIPLYILSIPKEAECSGLCGKTFCRH